MRSVHWSALLFDFIFGVDSDNCSIELGLLLHFHVLQTTAIMALLETSLMANGSATVRTDASEYQFTA